jgi:hypothetical protein
LYICQDFEQGEETVVLGVLNTPALADPAQQAGLIIARVLSLLDRG